MHSNDHDRRVINDLIQVTIDSADGYRKAGEEAGNHNFQSIFFDRANERERLVDKMQDFVRAQGAEPETDGSLSAGAHRLFLDIRDAIAGNDDRAIVAEVERGEDYIKESFETAQRDTELSTEARALIDECYRSVAAGHDQMRDLKHGLENAPSSPRLGM